MITVVYGLAHCDQVRCLIALPFSRNRLSSHGIAGLEGEHRFCKNETAYRDRFVAQGKAF